MAIRKTLRTFALPYVRRMVAAVAAMATKVALKAGEKSLRLTIEEFESQRSQSSTPHYDSYPSTLETTLKGVHGADFMTPRYEPSSMLIDGSILDSLENTGETIPHIGWSKASSSITELSILCGLTSLVGRSKSDLN